MELPTSVLQPFEQYEFTVHLSPKRLPKTTPEYMNGSQVLENETSENGSFFEDEER